MTAGARLSLAAGAVLLVCACSRDNVSPLGQPLASLSDGAHSGNPDFFFLPPLFPNPVNNPNFSPNAFNPNVRPTVEICELVSGACGTTIKTFAASDITLDATSQLYQVNWNTSLSNLVLTSFYRIRVLLGTQVLGFADVDPVASGSQLKNVQTGEFIGLVDGRTLPIKFRIENGAACNGGQCNSKTIDPTLGGFVVFDATGDRVDIPAQPSGSPLTVTVQSCPNLAVDIPVFGNCLRVTADPPLGETALNPPATVSLCSVRSFVLPPLHAQQDLLTLHRRDGEVINALPHSTDFCAAVIGRTEDNAPRGLAARGLRALRHAAEWMLKPAPLHASSLMFDVGAGGQTSGFSDFQFALPAIMSFASLQSQTGVANSPVSSVPAVQVTDARGNPVANATVHFAIASGGGSITPALGTATSDANGVAALTQWQLGDLNPNGYSVLASGFGIAAPPRETPFAPEVFNNAGEDELQTPVQLGSGQLTFTATAATTLLVRPVSNGITPASGITLPFTALSGISMESGTGVQLEVSPSTAVTWSSSDPLGSIGSVNTTGLVAVVLGNDAADAAHELVVTATAPTALGSIKINSFNFNHFRRFTTLVWRPVAGAASYEVQIEFGTGCTTGTAICTTWTTHFGSPATTTNTAYAFEFVGAQPGRWRVVARSVTGAVISTSEDVFFAYGI